MKLPWAKRKRYSSTLRTQSVEYSGENYEIRELTGGERVAFVQFAQENTASALLVYSWLLSIACIEFAGESPSDLALNVGPGAIQFLASEILDLSDMADKAEEKAEKKLESSPS